MDGLVEFFEVDLLIKFKLLGVDVVSFGDVMGVIENCFEVVINDVVKCIYVKLVFFDDVIMLFGGVLVGDVLLYGVLWLMVGVELFGDFLVLIVLVGFGVGVGVLGVGVLLDLV